MDQIDVATLMTALLILFFFHQVGQLWSLGRERWSEKKPRRLRPRTPEDCPYCGEEHESALSSIGATTAATGSVQGTKESARQAQGKTDRGILLLESGM